MKNKKIDEYIEKSEDFAKPILKHLRELVHLACPEVGETIKWGFPHFEYSGVICSMAAFKHHCAFGFWKENLIPGLKDLAKDYAMGSLGQLKSLSDLPSDKILIKFIKEAARLNKEGIKIVKPKTKKSIEIPDYFLKELIKNKKALHTFENFSPTNKKEYIEWVTEAKTQETLNKRLKTAIEWMSQGKIRNWKYIK